MGWPSSRRYSSSTLHPGRTRAFVLFGGADYTTGSCKCRGDMWKFEIEAGTWTQLWEEGSSPTPRYRQSLDLFQGEVYLFGGESYKPYMYHNSLMKFALDGHPNVQEL